jgi:hypothetical protein
MQRSLVAAPFVLALLFAVPAYATDFSSSNFTVKDPVQASGGGYATSTNFQLWSSLEQPAIGKSTSASNELRAGFLYFSTTAPPPPPPPPPPSDPGGGGPVGPPPPPSPFPGLGSIIEPIISLITGEPIPLPGCKRSDFNCDGSVDLIDLSILLTKPKAVTSKVLSFIFSDWTKQLPALFGGGQLAATPPSEAVTETPPTGLAQVSSAVGESATGTPAAPPKSSRGFFRKIFVGFITVVHSFFTSLFKALGA